MHYALQTRGLRLVNTWFSTRKYVTYEIHVQTTDGGRCRRQCEHPHELVQALSRAARTDGPLAQCQGPPTAYREVYLRYLLHRCLISHRTDGEARTIPFLIDTLRVEIYQKSISKSMMSFEHE